MPEPGAISHTGTLAAGLRVKHGESSGRGAPTAVLISAAVVLVVVVVAVAWQVIGSGDGNDAITADGMDAEAFLIAQPTDADEVREFAAQSPLYWAGELPDAEIELSRPAPDRAFIRYLTAGAEAGDPRPIFLTVATYEVEDAPARLQEQAASGEGALQPGGPEGATIYGSDEHPESIWLAFEGEDVQVEVFAPEPGRALQLARSGLIFPVS